jgi:general secretion pathway protein K
MRIIRKGPLPYGHGSTSCATASPKSGVVLELTPNCKLQPDLEFTPDRKLSRDRKGAVRGSALLAVLWLTAALTVIAFSVAATVRGETERASTASEGVRAYYLATGAIDRACLWIYWGVYYGYRNPDGSAKYYQPPMPRIDYDFPTGHVVVEIQPEGGKLNVNTASPADIEQLILALGIDNQRAHAITAGIVNWRAFSDSAAASALSFGPGSGPASTFQPRHASLEELEEILLVPGMTPEIFYGRYDHDPSGRLIPRGGLRDSLTVWGASQQIDVNTAPAALLQSVGVPPDAITAILARRLQTAFKNPTDIQHFVTDPVVAARLGTGGNSIWTLRATARARTGNGRFSDLRRTVSAVVKLLDPGQFDPPYHILRWYDDAWSPGIPAL